MAQLTDDCFAFSGPLLPVDEVERIINERVAAVAEIETVALKAALWTRVGEPPSSLPWIFRRSTIPPSTATRCATPTSTAGKRAGSRSWIGVTAGRAPLRALAPGEAIRIFTGAPMPAGADTVFMQEDVRTDGKAVMVPAGVAMRRQPAAGGRGRALRLDRAAGGPPAGGAARRTCGRNRPHRDFDVRRRVRVAVFSTGDEIIEPGAARPGARIVRCQPLSARRPGRKTGRRRRPISAFCRMIRRALAARACTRCGADA